MVKMIKSSTFDQWLCKLRDREAVARITARIDRLAHGNPGDVTPVGQGISEMRLTYGPGYRVYYMQCGSQVVVLLCGGDKSSQQHDIAQAKRIADQWRC